MDYRDLYAKLTGDFKTPYAPAETDREGFMYSDATIKRAVEALQSVPAGAQEAFMMDALNKYGPRRGATVGMNYPLTYSAGEDYARGLIDMYEGSETRGEQFSNAVRGLLAPFGRGMAPQTRAGLTQGLLRYAFERARGE